MSWILQIIINPIIVFVESQFCSQQRFVRQGTKRGEFARQLAYATTEQSELMNRCVATLRANREQHEEHSWNSSHEFHVFLSKHGFLDAKLCQFQKFP